MISIVIPSDGKIDVLKKCLDKLYIQSLPSDLFETIVVFNTERRNALEIFANENDILHDYEPRWGSYAARNRGISLAQGEIVAFTDADCLPSEGWLKNIWTIFKSDLEIQIIGGKIITFPTDENNISPSEYIDLIFSFNQKRYIQSKNFSATANMAVRRSTLEKIGLFQEEMMSGGDKEWGDRATKIGYKIGYFDQIIIYHPARYTMSMLLRKRKRLSKGHYHLEMIKNKNPLKYLFNTAKLFFPPLTQIRDILKYDQYGIGDNPGKKVIIIVQLFTMRVYSGMWRILLLFRRST